MIGLDTNVVVRFLVQDDPKQAKLANQCIENCLKNGETLWICQVTLCEIFWVLQRCYKLTKKELISVFTSLLQTRQIVVQREDVARQALRDYESSTKAGFPDCLIGRQNASNECRYTYTFDKDAAKHLNATFHLLK